MSQQQTIQRLIIALVLAVLLAASLAVGLIVIIVKNNSSNDNVAQPQQQQNPYDAQLKQDNQAAATLGQQLLLEIETNGLENMKRNLHNITHNVHVAGTDEQMAVLQYIKDMYTSYGLEVMTTDYDVMLSYPDYSNPNTVSMQQPNGTWSPISTGLGDIPTGPKELVDQILVDKKALNWWNAYSGNGTAIGRLVYANYGQAADFQFLDNQNISVNGSIVVMRFLTLVKGNKAVEAEKRGALGVIFYSDPMDYGASVFLSNPNNTFPNSVYMPPGDVTRESMLETNGDPLTPLYPAKNYTYRSNINDVINGVTIPTIPVMPIGYRDAIKLFQIMNGAAVPPDWTGGMAVNYTLTSTVLFELKVNAVTPPRQTIRNVIAFMRGSAEPDKYILLTNHVDAFTYGAMDPNSGTAAILETARALTTVANATGWRPRRTIVFCSFDAQEFGLIGSHEFAEEYLKVLQQRAVAVFNVDAGVLGNVVLFLESSPSLYRTLIRAAKLVPNPNDNETNAGRTTLYDSWMFYFPNGSFVEGQPLMPAPDAISDQHAFLSFVGVPVVYFGTTCNPSSRKDCYALFHTMFEVPWSLENLVDPGYKALKGMAQYWTEIARDFSDTLVIPFNLNDYATVLTKVINMLDGYLMSRKVPDLLANGAYTTIMSNLKGSTVRFTTAASNLQTQVDAINSGETSATLRQVEILNSRLMGLERAFINDRGLYANRQEARHVLFSPSMHDPYSGALCAGVYDSVEYYFETNDITQKNVWLKSIEITLSELQFSIESAILLLDYKV